MRDIARRSLLAGISAVSGATLAPALPSAVLAHPVADRDAIVLARRVARLATLDTEACNRFADAYDARPSDPERVAHAERRARRTSDSVERAAATLTLMKPQSLAGAVAKAQAFQAIQQSGWENGQCEWRDDLATSIVADVLRIGGQANV